MSELKDRLKEARKDAKLSQAKLAQLAGLKNQSIVGNIENGHRKTTTYIVQLARVLKVEPLWLDKGEGPKRTENQSPGNAPLNYEANVTTHHAPRNRVPIISAVQAGDFSFAEDRFQPGYAEEYIETSVPVKSHTFALKVKGDSMEPEFTEGMILIVEPEMDFSPNDFVIVKNGDEATFKQLIKDGLDWYLKPLNPRYPIKPLGGSKIIGVVREATRRLK